jgi:hypothetical protein
MSYGPVTPVPSFLATTETFPKDNSQLLTKLTNVYSNIANTMNVREVAIYDLQRLSTGQKFFNPSDTQNLRQTFRTVYRIGSVAPGASLSVAHGISGLTAFTRMYGTLITNVVDHRPLPYVDITNVTNQVSLRADGTNFYVSNGATAPAITSGIVILEYLMS